MKFKIGDKVRAIVSDPRVANTIVTITDAEKVMDIQYYIAQDTNGEKWGFSEDELEPVYADSRTIKEVIDDYRNQLLNLYRASIGKRADNIYFDEWTFKEEKKMPTKFTFYVTDWVNINKTNGEKIPMKRTVAYIGSNTDVEADTSCPVAEYDERTGCLIAAAKISAKRSTEAKMMYNIARSTWGTELSWAIFFELANTALNGNFERTYKKFHNDNIRFEKKRLTCSFCGKVFDTVEEKRAEEAWHVERKKARRERYLLRKRAKEIAFEQKAQEMAKEMIDAKKGDK